MKYFKCYSARLAHYLIKHGYWITGIEPNLKKPWFDVYLFPDSEELRKLVDQYCKQ